MRGMTKGSDGNGDGRGGGVFDQDEVLGRMTLGWDFSGTRAPSAFVGLWPVASFCACVLFAGRCARTMCTPCLPRKVQRFQGPSMGQSSKSSKEENLYNEGLYGVRIFVRPLWSRWGLRVGFLYRTNCYMIPVHIVFTMSARSLRGHD